MVQYKRNQKRDLAVSLRRGGYSYSEIQKMVPVPKATLSYWFRDLELTEAQRARLDKKRIEAAKVGAKNRLANIERAIEEIQKHSAKEVGKVSKRELWLMGVMLYWKNHNVSDIRKGVHFMSGDPYLIRLFLKWLREVGSLADNEITFDLFLKGRNRPEAVDFWAAATGYSASKFGHFYRHKNKAKFGLLRIRVKASSMLARQLSGWIRGVQEML
jgi:hypothetical protein